MSVWARTPGRVWGVPLALAAVTVAGLPAGLFGDGGWDWLSALLLAAPVLVALERLARARRPRPVGQPPAGGSARADP